MRHSDSKKTSSDHMAYDYQESAVCVKGKVLIFRSEKETTGGRKKADDKIRIKPQ